MDVWWNILSDAGMDRAHKKTLWDKQAKHKFFKMNVKLIFFHWVYDNQMRKERHWVFRVRRGEKKGSYHPVYLQENGSGQENVTSYQQFWMPRLSPMSVAGHCCVCLLPHTASVSRRAWGDSTWQSWYAKWTAFFLLPTLKIPSCIITWFCWEKLQWKKGLLVYGIREDKTGFSIPVPFVHARRLLAERWLDFQDSRGPHWLLLQ